MSEPIKCFWLEPVDDQSGKYRRQDTGDILKLWEAPPGAMWDADWMKTGSVKIDCKVIHLVVRLPNQHDWMPRAFSNNCNRVGEDHDCWCVHGTVPNLTVDKTPEPGRTTCQVGGGSIASGKEGTEHYWHGFMRNGELVSV